MQRHFADVGANGITEDAARSWVSDLVSGERSALTVREVWLSASRRVFRWGVEQKHVHKNPFADIKVGVPKKVRTRETGKAFTPEEAQTILKASLACENPKTPWERAKRWVPWLCAYSGARSGEITQLRGSDIEQRGRFYVMKLTPEADTIKTGETRCAATRAHHRPRLADSRDCDQGFRLNATMRSDRMRPPVPTIAAGVSLPA
jgi:integrase